MAQIIDDLKIAAHPAPCSSLSMELRFVKSESTFSHFEALESYLRQQGRPVAFYSDKHTVFRVAKEDAEGGARMTRFGRALNALNVEILCASLINLKPAGC